MASVFSYIRRLFAPRRHERFWVKNGTFVIVSPGTNKEQKVQLIDISQGGTAFIYQGDTQDLEKSGVLKILADYASLSRVNFDTVSDKPAPASVNVPVPYRRRGVKFKWMGILEQADLREFIKRISIQAKE